VFFEDLSREVLQDALLARDAYLFRIVLIHSHQPFSTHEALERHCFASPPQSARADAE